MGDAPALEPLDRDLWVASRPLRLVVGDVGARMTVVRLAGGDLWLHSPVPLDAPLREALAECGRVRWLVGPSLVHHLFLGSYADAFPGATLVGAPGLPEKRRDLRFGAVMDEDFVPPWGDEIRHCPFRGAPRMQEVVFLHAPTRTLILTDLAFHVHPERDRARLFHWLVGATGRFGPHRLARSLIRHPAAARGSLATILAWDFDRVIVSHGDVLESGGLLAMQRAFAFLGAGSSATRARR